MDATAGVDQPAVAAALWFSSGWSDEGVMRRIVVLAALLAFWPHAATAQEQLHQAVEAYALYQSDITTSLDANISDAAALDAALARAVRHNPEGLTQGWLAYGALTAAQSPAWVNGVRARVRAAGRAAVLRQLRRDLTYARRRPPGANEATQLVLRAMAADTARMNALAARLDGLGAAADTSAWARRAGSHSDATRVTDIRRLEPDVLARLHLAPLTAAPLTEATAFGGVRFWDSFANRASPAPPSLLWRVVPARAQSLDRMLTLAALLVVDANESETARVLTDEPVQQCLAMQQLQLRQCVSVTHDPNEDAFCIARHGYAGPSACLQIGAPG